MKMPRLPSEATITAPRTHAALEFGCGNDDDDDTAQAQPRCWEEIGQRIARAMSIQSLLRRLTE